MDSVTQKNNILSMTGIDQTEQNSEDILDLQNEMNSVIQKTNELEAKITEHSDDILDLQNDVNSVIKKTDEIEAKTTENTEDISDLKNDLNSVIKKTDEIEGKTTKNTNDITTLNGIVMPFAQNIAPYIVQKDDINQTIDGVKTFLKPLLVDGFDQIPQSFLGSTIYQPIKFCSGSQNSMSFSRDDGLEVNGKTTFHKNVLFNPQGKYSTGKSSMTFDVNNGFNVAAPITLLPNALKISNISGLQDALNVATDIPDRSITNQKIALNTILGENLSKAISFSTTGDIGSVGGTFAVCNSQVCKSGIYRLQNNAPLLNVCIPCVPKLYSGRDFNLYFYSYNNYYYTPFFYPFKFTVHCIVVRPNPKKDFFDTNIYESELEFTLIERNPIPGFSDIYTTVKIGKITVINYPINYVLPIPLVIDAGIQFTVQAKNSMANIEFLCFEIYGYQC